MTLNIERDLEPRQPLVSEVNASRLIRKQANELVWSLVLWSVWGQVESQVRSRIEERLTNSRLTTLP
jgi:hypothetical protein